MSPVIEHLQTRKHLALAVLLGAMVLSACQDQNSEILVGSREGLRDVLQDSDPAEDVTNEVQPISLVAVQNNSDWAQFFGSPAERTSHPSLSSVPQLQWSQSIGQGNSRRQRISADPVVGGGAVYTLDAVAGVTATSTSGAVLWRRDLAPENDGSGDATGGGLAYADGSLYVGLGFGTLTALDASDGSVLWTQDLEATASGAPSVSGDLVYISSGDDTGWAIDKNTGRVQWQIGGTESVANVLGAPAPVVTSDLAIFAFGSGDVQAVFRRGGLSRWGTSVVGERRGFALSKVGDITAAPVVDGTRLYAGNQSGRVVALDTGNGSRIWTAREGATGPVWPAGDSVFFVTDQNELVRLSSSDGRRIWGVDLPKFVAERARKRAEIVAHFGPVLAGGRLVIASSDGVMRSFDPTDGALIGTVDIPNGAASYPAIAGGTLYVVNARGDLLAYR